jgi:tetratricopeptide (TPR) repeat protein
MRRVLVVGLLAFALRPVIASAQGAGEAPAPGAADTPATDSTDSEAAARAAARARALGLASNDDEDEGYRPRSGIGGSIGSILGGRSGLFGLGIVAVAFYFLFMRGRGGGGSANWGSYYLFWIVAPAVLAAVSSHPEILIVVVVGLVARRWLPDPFLALRHGARIRTLEVDVSSNAGNITARRDLAALWLEKRRPRRALPLLEQALARDANAPELLFLRGRAQLALGQSEPALDSLLSVVHREPTFRYGEGYLRAADALIALGRWDDAEEALQHFLKINSSSVEGFYKRVRVCKARKDDAGARQARRDLRDAWRSLPSFQRRKQLGWYVRALVAG